MKHFSKPLSLYEIDVLHYTSVGSDKQYFVDALIMKAVAEDGEPIYSKKDEEKLLAMKTSELEAMYFEMFNNEIPEN
mgnify:FL=1|tara:strand:+ start:1060 stop:1290 length:231 start_codon:yes stop_codon:yes gene_type:complete